MTDQTIKPTGCCDLSHLQHTNKLENISMFRSHIS
jgi:hypothetical protein